MSRWSRRKRQACRPRGIRSRRRHSGIIDPLQQGAPDQGHLLEGYVVKILLILVNDLTFPDGKGWADKNKAFGFGYRPTRKYAYAPTTLTTLAALVPSEIDAEVEIVDEGVQRLPEDFQADLVGISTNTPNAMRAYGIADRARQKGMKVVLGGWHPTALPSEAMQHADAVVKGYAERSWPQLLLDFQNNHIKTLYEAPWADIFEGNMPFARRDLLRKGAYMFPCSLEATRGCLNHCEFCVVPGASKGVFHTRPVDQVIEEIKCMGRKTILFLDFSPNEDLDYAKGLYEALIPLGISWYGATTTKTAEDDEWLDLVVRSGCKGLLIGFESLDQEALARTNKGFNNARKYHEFIQKLHNHAISVLGCFVFGFDGNDSSVFEKTFDLVNDASIELCNFSILIPLPGSLLFERMKRDGRIITTDWRLYDGRHVVFEPQNMTIAELKSGLHWIWERTYGYRSIFKRSADSRKSRLSVLAANMGLRLFSRTFLPGSVTKMNQNGVPS